MSEIKPSDLAMYSAEEITSMLSPDEFVRIMTGGPILTEDQVRRILKEGEDDKTV